MHGKIRCPPKEDDRHPAIPGCRSSSGDPARLACSSTFVRCRQEQGRAGGGGSGGGRESAGTKQQGGSLTAYCFAGGATTSNRLSQLVGDNHADLKELPSALRSKPAILLLLYRLAGDRPPAVEKEDLGGRCPPTGIPNPTRKRASTSRTSISTSSKASSKSSRSAKTSPRRTADRGGRRPPRNRRCSTRPTRKRGKDEIAAKQKELESVRMQIADYNQSRSQEGYKVSQLSQVRIGQSPTARSSRSSGACGLLRADLGLRAGLRPRVVRHVGPVRGRGPPAHGGAHPWGSSRTSRSGARTPRWPTPGSVRRWSISTIRDRGSPRPTVRSGRPCSSRRGNRREG